MAGDRRSVDAREAAPFTLRCLAAGLWRQSMSRAALMHLVPSRPGEAL